MKPIKRVMWIEHKLEGLSGPARIGWAQVKEKGKGLEYKNQLFRSLRGQGYKTNYFDMETGEKYWISDCRKDGRDALHNTNVDVDGDALEEYCVQIRGKPENIGKTKFRALGKHN